jgi:hypothetical protein
VLHKLYACPDQRKIAAHANWWILFRFFGEIFAFPYLPFMQNDVSAFSLVNKFCFQISICCNSASRQPVVFPFQIDPGISGNPDSGDLSSLPFRRQSRKQIVMAPYP